MFWFLVAWASSPQKGSVLPWRGNWWSSQLMALFIWELCKVMVNPLELRIFPYIYIYYMFVYIYISYLLILVPEMHKKRKIWIPLRWPWTKSTSPAQARHTAAKSQENAQVRAAVVGAPEENPPCCMEVSKKRGVPQHGWFMMENSIEIYGFGGPMF